MTGGKGVMVVMVVIASGVGQVPTATGYLGPLVLGGPWHLAGGGGCLEETVG